MRRATQKATSYAIDRLTAGVSVTNESPWVVVDQEAQYIVEALKGLTRFYVINNSATAIARHGQVQSVIAVQKTLSSWLTSSETRNSVPILLQYMFAEARQDVETRESHGYGDSAIARRTVADYLCTLTESQVVDLAQRLQGSSPASMFGAWFSN